MSRNRFKDVEKELYNLCIYEKIIEQRQYDLLDKGPKCEIPAKGMSDPTAYEAIRKDRIKKELEVYEKKVKALKLALTCLTETEIELINLKYIEKNDYNNSEVMNYMDVSKNKYYALKWSALEKLKEVLGDEYFLNNPFSGQKRDN